VVVAQVKIYTRQWCGYCTRALRLLDAKNIAYEHVDATNDQSTRAWLAKTTGQSTVPQIFIDGRSIGGCDELHDLERRGELDRMLQSSSTGSG
jgi:glutaredoxin 3